ncbi:glycosyl hydrolase family 28-related protein [Actinoplanes sp. NPDC023936]|uniref:right-handed parallel beta-helix repeat-containing protein n=1 Tax=Actinoplanes sp. NPDC023936 TaxID=3154910 RepID=UPI00340F13B0
MATVQHMTAAVPLVAGQVVWMGGGSAQPFVPGPAGMGADQYAAHRGTRPLGITLGGAAAAAPVDVQILGQVDTAVVTLGPGARSMIGWDADGAVVRVPDPACCSHPNYVGWCDELGTVFVEPAYRQTSFNIRDFGATGDGLADDTAAIEAALAAAARLSTVIFGQGIWYGGGVVYVPSGSYRVTRSLILPRHTRLVGESMRTAALFFYLPETGTIAEDPQQGSGIVCTNEIAANGYPQTGVEDLSIIGAWTGTISERAKRLGAGLLFKGGGPLCGVRRCAIEGWRVGIWFDTINIATVEQCNIGGNVGAGYPDGWTAEDNPAEAYPLSVKTWGVWLASIGIAARIEGAGSAFETIVGGETLLLAYDDAPDDTLSSTVTITFQPADTTVPDVIDRINAEMGYPCASQVQDSAGHPQLVLSGRKPSWWSRIRIVGGSGLAKLGLEDALASGSGSGLGNEILNSGNTCNLVNVRDCQFNGPHVGIYLEDGIGHTIESCNFNMTPRLAAIHGGVNSVFRRCVSEGCSTTGVFYVAGTTGLTIEACEAGGFWSQNEFPEVGGYSRPTQTAFVEFAPAAVNYHIRIRDNMIFGATGPAGTFPCSPVNTEGAPYALLGQVDIRGNTTAVGDRFVGPHDVGDSSTIYLNDDRRGCLGIGTAQPEALLDIRPSYSDNPTIKFKRQMRGGLYTTAVEALSLDDATREHGLGRHVYDGGDIQQGMVEILQRGDWAAGDPDELVHVDVRRHAVCDFEISVLMRSGTSAEAKRWRFCRLVYWSAGTAYLDTEPAEDTERTIGNSLAWLSPTIAIDDSQRLTITVKAATTEASSGTWIVRIENLQRSVF